MTDYTPRGYLKLSRREEAFPTPEPGEWEDLHQLAFKLGYKVRRATVREDAEIPMLKHSSTVIPLEFPASNRGTEHSDEMSFRFPSVDLEDIDDLERGLPDFFQELQELGIEAEMDFDFIPVTDGQGQISLVWFPGSSAITRADFPYHSDGATQDLEAPLSTDEPIRRAEDGTALVSSSWLDSLTIDPEQSDTFEELGTISAPPLDGIDDDDWARI